MDEDALYLATFRLEAEELLHEMETVILLVEEDPENDDAINRLFRAVHTLKGLGGMFGLTDVINFSHALESVLDLVRSKQLAISRDLIDLSLAYRDQVGIMLGAAGSEGTLDGELVERICSRLASLCPPSPTVATASERAFATSTPAAPPKLAEHSGQSLTYRIQFVPPLNLFFTGADPTRRLDDLRALGPCTVVVHIDAIPALEIADPEECHLAWDIILTTAAGLNAVKDVFVFVEDFCKIAVIGEFPGVIDENGGAPRLGDILLDRGDVTSATLHASLKRQTKIGDLLVDTGEVSRTQVAAALGEQQAMVKQTAAAKNDSVRVPSDKLDALINLVGELVTNQARLGQVASRIGDVMLASPVEEADRLTSELRDIVLNVRMMPIGTTFSRFNRLVRDLSADLGKQIDLATEGAETKLDKTVIDRLSDPLVHLIRNSIDHGIEAPAERLKAGKPARGTITLRAVHKGASVVISIADDGKGLNAESLLAKARKKGLIAPDAVLTQKEIFALIFLPGFSTAEKVTDISGRGVGMDVVKREIDFLRGLIEVRSDPGRGTCIDLSLPLTLAIIDGLLVNIGPDCYVIPLVAVEECMELTQDRFATTLGRNLIQVRGAPVSLIRLRDVFGISGPGPSLEQAVVVNVGDIRVGLAVDQVVGNHQTVIKSLGNVYRRADCISGATITGDGNVALILDLSGIIRNAKADETAVMSRNMLKRQPVMT